MLRSSYSPFIRATRRNCYHCAARRARCCFSDCKSNMRLVVRGFTCPRVRPPRKPQSTQASQAIQAVQQFSASWID